MALKWYELDDIVTRQATVTRSRGESAMSWLQSQEEARRREREKAAAARNERTASQWLAIGRAKQCARASQELFEANKQLTKLGISPMLISQSNVKRQISSGHGWANQLVQQTKNQIYLDQQEQEAELRSDIMDDLLKEGTITYDTPPDVVDTMYQQARATYYADEAFKRGDYENATYWRDVAKQLSPGYVSQEPSAAREQVWIPPDETGATQQPSMAGQATPEMALATPETKQARIPAQESMALIDYRRDLIDWATEQGIDNPPEFVQGLMAQETGDVEMRSISEEELGKKLKLPPMPTFMNYLLPSFLERIFSDPLAEESLARTAQLYTKKEVVGVMGESAKRLPRQTFATILQATQGQGGASVVNRDWADRYIKAANEDIEQFSQEVAELYPSIPFLIESSRLSQNLAYSMTSMGAGLAVGVPIAFIPLPGARIAAWGFGTAASGAVAYQMTTYQIMQQYLEMKDAEKRQQTGRGLTLQEENQLKADFHNKARNYGLWEAVPEAISNLAFALILVDPLGKVAGTAIAEKIATKLGMMYGEELLTETITQKGQSDIEVETGLRENRIGWVEAFREVAPQTMLLTTVMGGAGQVIVGTSSAIQKARTSLKNEIGIEHPLYDEINEGLDAYVTQKMAEVPTEGIQVPEKGIAMPSEVQQEFLARAETWLQQVPEVKPNTLHTVGVPGGEAFVRTDVASNVEVAGISLMREGRLTLSEVVAAKPGGLAESEAGADIINYVRENNIALPPEGEMSEAARGFLAKVGAETTAFAEGETITGEIGEGEVTVEIFKPITALRQLQQRYIKQREDTQTFKNELVKYIKKWMPKEAQGKMLAQVKNVRTQAELSQAFEMADRLAEQYAQKALTTKIRGELQARKLATRKEYGRFTPEAQRKLNAIKNNLGRDRADIQDEILRNIEAAEEGKITLDDVAEANEVLAASGLKGMSSQEMAYALQYIKALKQTGRGIRAAEAEARKERLDTIRAEGQRVATGGKGIKPGVGVIDTRGLWARVGKLKSFLTNWQFGMDDVLDSISRLDKLSKPFESVFNKLGDRLHLARSIQQAGTTYYLNRISTKVSEVYSLKGRRQLMNHLSRMSKDKIDLGTFQPTEGQPVKLELTKGQIIEKYLQLQDPTLDETFREGMKWTDEMMSAVKDSMTAEDIKFADWILKFYQEYGQTIKPIYEAKYHLPWPDNPSYSPLNRDLEAGTYEHIMMTRDLFRYASVANRSTRARTRNRVPLRFNDATDVLMNHIIQMEHFKAFSEPMREARGVLGNSEIRTAIRQYHGQDVLTHIDRHLNDIARDGLDKAKINRNLDMLRRHFTLAALGLKPLVSIKQAGSLPAYLTYEKMPVADFFDGVADFWKAPIAHMREMKEQSGYLTERWGRGHERDIRLATRQGYTARLANAKNWRDMLMLGIRGVDSLTTMAGSWAVYRSMQKQKLSKQESITHAEIATKRSQPSFGLEDMAALRKEGSFWQLATMFMSQPNKYYRLIANSMRNIRYGRGSKSRQVTNILLAWWVLPALFQFASDAFQWKEEHQLRVGLLGPANYILVAGQLLQSLWGIITKEPFTYEISPVVDSVREIEWAVARTLRMIEQGQDPLKEVDTEYLIRTIEHYASAAGQLAGVPTPYAIQVERAIREADPRQMIFTQYALSNPKKDIIAKVQDNYAKQLGAESWGKLTKDQRDWFWTEIEPYIKK